MNRIRVFGAILALLGACAHPGSAPKDPTGTAVALASKRGEASRSQKTCETEIPVGTHFPVIVCRSQEDRDLERERSKQALRIAPQCVSGNCF
jgi:hypothetical protein